MSKRILLVCILWLVPLAAWAHAPVILVMGDSLSAAYGIGSDRGWVNLLQQRLAADHYDYTVINASVSGETTAGGLTRFPAEMQTHHPAVVVLELGANDGLRGLPVPVMRANLGRMIVMARAAHARVLLVGMLLPPNYGAPYTKAFAAAYPSLARQYHVPLVPFLLDKVASHPERMQEDGLHPNADSEPQVLDNVWPFLKPLLNK